MNKYKIVYYTLANIALLLFIQCSNNHQRLHKELTKRAVELNQSTPRALDEHTIFEGVEVSEDNVFQYFYTIINTDNPNELIAIHKKEIMERIDKIYTTDKSLGFFVKHGVIMSYIYKDTEQNVIDIITIATDKYKKSQQQ